MALREEFERAGNWLFRWRGQLPLVMIAICIVALGELEYPSESEEIDEPWELFCLAISCIGLGIRIFTIGHTPKGTSGRNTTQQVADTLNTNGIYSVVRNPLYFGNFFMGLGPALFAHIWWLALIYCLIFLIYYERIIFSEEAYLRNKFGKVYLDWAEVTPVIVPKLSGYRKPDLPFSLKNVLKREYNGLFAVIVVFFILKVANDLIVEHELDVDEMWAAILAVSFIIWMILRTLKRKTTLLDVQGR